ncbi:hypothetical protein JOB18_029412 [Solea senegalensis]|uniref:Uncharacterized protein n=1 Tax=Solea senegalensis TaxID=28829 RepID=A0AAV6RXS8_SOLSE|nr:hypothetical protein JOB18_029412 [Solea senegalensis]
MLVKRPHYCPLLSNALDCGSADCDLVLKEALGQISSPCYPDKYPNSQSCRWVLQAPAGFVVQLSFLDFDLEEAPGCIYDHMSVNTGDADVKFCGPTADGLTLNSTGNVMEITFSSDFSVQKRGFSVSFRHVAVALRNQKVQITSGNGQVTMVANSVTMPTLSHFTLCFEVQRNSQKQREWLFTYFDHSRNIVLSLGSAHSTMSMIVDGVSCSVTSILSSADFTSSMKTLCLTWTSSDGVVTLYFEGQYQTTSCPASRGHSIPAGGQFRLGGQHALDGFLYNLRLWDYAMTEQQLRALTCDTTGNALDWDNSQWTVPPTLAQTDATLSCSVSPPGSTPLTTSCDSPGLGCPGKENKPSCVLTLTSSQ